MTTIHWHAGHNVSGYLPESDEPNAYETWEDAMSSLVSDLEFAWDDADTILNGDTHYLDAHTAMHNAAAGAEFQVYTPTHLDSEHDIPTAWWVVKCNEDVCLADLAS